MHKTANLTRKPRSGSSGSSGSGHGRGSRDSGSIRIVAGKWKKSRLQIPPVDGLRPTPDRIRETLFNWLGQDLSGCIVADCFAGTGVLGLEAASRGARQVYFLERNVNLIQALSANIQRLCKDSEEKQVFRVLPGEVEHTLSRLSLTAVDLVFWDPPYQNTVYSPILRAACNILVDGGLLYLEAGQNLRADALGYMAELNLSLLRYAQAGQVHAHLWRKQNVPG